MKSNRNKRPMGLDALLENQLGHWAKFLKLHICSFSTTRRGWWCGGWWGGGGGGWGGIVGCGCVSKWGAWYLAIGQNFRSCTKCQKLHIYSLSPQGVEIELIFALRAAVSEIHADFQNSHIWAWNLAICQSSRNCTYIAYSTPRVPNFTPFCSTAGHFQDWLFFILPLATVLNFNLFTKKKFEISKFL